MTSQAISDDKRGLTLVELLITIGITLVLVVALAPLSSNLFGRAQVGDVGETLAQDIHLSWQRSVARLNNASHGIHFVINVNGDDSYTVFQGDSYATRNQLYDKTVTIPANIRLFTLVAWPDQDLVFSRGRGTPNATTTITVTDTNTESGMRLYVLESGVVNFEPFGTGGSGGK